MGLGHDNDQQHCPSHQMFESLIKQALDNLSERMIEGVAALRTQNEATTKKTGASGAGSREAGSTHWQRAIITSGRRSTTCARKYIWPLVPSCLRT